MIFPLWIKVILYLVPVGSTSIVSNVVKFSVQSECSSVVFVTSSESISINEKINFSKIDFFKQQFNCAELY